MGQIIQVEQTMNTPSIYIDKAQNYCKIEGSSFPEDASETYTPVFNWLAELQDNFTDELKIEFEFDFLNSISHKKVWTILNTLKAFYKKGKPVKVVWWHDEDDEEIMETGEDLAELLSFPFDVCELDS